MFINQATVFGNLTRDPELKSLPSGQSVCSFSVATNKKFKDKDGNMKEEVQYHNIVVWGRQAETTAQYMKKGSSIYIQGELQTRSWETDGHKNYRTEINARTVQFGPKPAGASQEAPPASAPAQASPVAEPMPDYPEEDINPEDIPF